MWSKVSRSSAGRELSERISQSRAQGLDNGVSTDHPHLLYWELHEEAGAVSEWPSGLAGPVPVRVNTLERYEIAPARTSSLRSSLCLKG